MVREITTTVYTFDELSEDAQEKAVEEVRGKFAGAWWDSDDNDAVEGAILVSLGDQLGEPKAADYGSGDYPGIPHVTLTGWDLERGGTVQLNGYLDRENAPRLPWTDGMVQVNLDSKRRDDTSITVESNELDDDGVTPTAEAVDAIVQAVRNAMSVAIAAGRTEYEYKTSEEYAREWCEGNSHEYNEDGSLYN